MKLESYIDYTFLKPDGSKGAIAKLCRTAKRRGYASVCVNPGCVREANECLKDSGVKVCTVIDFPLGQSTPQAREEEAVWAIADGARELDVVINQRLLKYDEKRCKGELEDLVKRCRYLLPKRLVLKLILECCNLTRKEIVRGAKMAKATGFDFVKTSTGFGKGGATVRDVRLLRKTVGKRMGVKAAGGIRDKETALKLIKAGATRIGTSSEL